MWALAEHSSSVHAEEGNSYMSTANAGWLDPETRDAITLHAELAVIASLVKKDKLPRKMTLYVAGYGKEAPLVNTKPCEVCSAVIKKAGVFDKVVFSENGVPTIASIEDL